VQADNHALFTFCFYAATVIPLVNGAKLRSHMRAKSLAAFLPFSRSSKLSAKEKALNPNGFKAFFWSCWADLNRRPHPYQ